jgi:hypothetical protein
VAKKIGMHLPLDLFEILKRGTRCILATFSEQGVPRTTPLHYMYPKGFDSILITIEKDHSSYLDMIWQKKVNLNFLHDGDISYSVLGRAGVVRAPSMVHPYMNIMRIDVMDVRNNKSLLARIDHGVSWSYNSLESEELYRNLVCELKELAKTI